MYKTILFIFLLLSFSKNSLSKPINFQGLSNLNTDDIQSITSINIYDNDLLIEDVNNIIKELALSDLIYEVSYEDTSNFFYVKIQEADLIQNIFINNNVWIKDDLILQNLTSKKNYFLIKDYVENDIKVIKNIYKSKGFQNILVTAKVEKFSKDRTNLIYEIKEGKQQKINIIKFVGNNFFSNNYLNTIIKSQSIKFYNIFKSGSNLNYSTFEFDKNQILLNYRNEGFTNVKVNYVLEKSTLDNNILYFYIEEGDRAKINNLQYNFENQSLFNFISKLSSKLEEDLKKNNYFYDKNLIDDYLETFNLTLLNNNVFNKVIDVNIDYNNENIDITFLDKNNLPVVINKINISGNSITKSKTIRSKISIEPGEYLNQYKLTNSSKNLKRYPYIKDVSLKTSITNQLADININIDEETKTGNILVAGTFNADTGAGLTFGIEDKNILINSGWLAKEYRVNLNLLALF